MESDLIFLGLLILENRLKEETKPVLEELISARIRTVMITGTEQSVCEIRKNWIWRQRFTHSVKDCWLPSVGQKPF